VRVAPPSHIVGVFQNAQWARGGLAALGRDGFSSDSLSIFAQPSDEARALFDEFLSSAPVVADIKGVGSVLAAGPLLTTLAGADAALDRGGLTGTMARAGFQTHDGQIFQMLLARGGVLVGVVSEPRAADALARLHSYGAGNAAIGAWRGRV
jgi:hypothetical protein